MAVPFVDLKLQYRNLQKELTPEIQSVLDNAQFILGPKVDAFEKAFAAFCGAAHAIGVGSGTSALTLLLQALGVKAGDECIVPANTFIATAEGVSSVGATPVFVDCEEGSGLIDVARIAEKITKNTKVIIPVHLFGQPADMDEILALAKENNLAVIEDACQAHGAQYKGRPTGSLARGAAFSFYPGKNLGAYGEGGGITTDDAVLNDTIRMLRDHGSRKRYHHELVGWNERLDGIQGAILNVKLKYLNDWNAKRHAHAQRYKEALKGVGDLCSIQEKSDRTHIYHLFVIRTAKRDALQKHLTDKGIQTGIHYPVPLHLQPAYKHLGYKEGQFPAAEKLGNEMLSLPMFAELTEEQIVEVCEAVKEFFAK